MGFLTEIVAATRERLDADPPDEDRLRADAASAPPPRNLAFALAGCARTEGVAVIAEVKRASPSAGPIAPDADPVVQAMAYDTGGAAAISVLTEPAHFAGSLADLRAVRRAVEHPVLRKDFVVHPVQVLEARAAGADSVLLITACLPGDALGAMLDAARSWGMEPLVETHSDDDLERALATDAQVIGVNARDLESLEVDVDASLARLRRVGSDRVAVAESGLRDRADVERVVSAGASAILVGEALMRAADPGRTIATLIHGEEPR
jgi:indole-3-glycerol phosphate synthase